MGVILTVSALREEEEGNHYYLLWSQIVNDCPFLSSLAKQAKGLLDYCLRLPTVGLSLLLAPKDLADRKEVESEMRFSPSLADLYIFCILAGHANEGPTFFFLASAAPVSA